MLSSCDQENERKANLSVKIHASSMTFFPFALDTCIAFVS